LGEIITTASGIVKSVAGISFSPGDYQPAEKGLQVSLQMLEVCLELGLLVSIPERSPLVLRNLELLTGT
jgi:DNA repair photolyase